MQADKRRRRRYDHDLAAVQTADLGRQGGHVEAGLQARADATVTVEHSKLRSNALQYMHGRY